MELTPFVSRFALMEERPFKEVRIMTSHPGRMRVIPSSHAELGGILLSHAAYSLVKDKVLAEEREPIKAKGIAKPVRNYRVLERIDDMVQHGKAIREEQDGLRILLDLQKLDKASAVKTLEGMLSRLKS